MNTRRRNIVIDLTSLLDVILILLFLILMSASASVERVRDGAAADKARLEQLTADNAVLRGEKERLQRDLDGYVYLDAHARFIHVFIESAPSGAREVCLESGEDVRKFTLTWQNAAVVRAALSQALSSMCEIWPADGGEQVVYILLRYDRNRIYQTDYALLASVIAGVKGEKGNVFSAEYDVLEEKADA